LSHASLAIEHGKPVLVEKAFTANEKEAKALVSLARQKGVYLAEAIWTRYMPMSFKIKELMDSGVIGEPLVLTATLCYPLLDKERVMHPDLCGGALLDVGVYVLNFAKMYFGGEVEKTITNCRMGETGVDLHELISLSYKDGRMANLQAGALCLNDRQGIISGTEGYIRVDNVNCPERIEVYRNYQLVDVFEKPEDMISGYEYQVIEARRCIEAGLLESPLMTHDETIYMMKWMDELRKSWGVVYPMD
jgi:predicted dehydrogenase